MSACSKAGCHAVLAPLSGCYPPLEGRSPTCYSPVRHSTHGLLHFRVRLACVRHAASVDSEPGSNSHVKCAVTQSRPVNRSNCLATFNAIADLTSSALFVCRLLWIALPLPADTRRVPFTRLAAQ